MRRILLLALLCSLRAAEAPTQREIVRQAMSARPSDPWPRGEGHVVLAVPGSREEEKAYLEPGGSFSPFPGSFGVSLRVMDGQKLVATSDSIPLEQVEQRFDWNKLSPVPAVIETTPYYKARWSLDGPAWTLEIDSGRELQLAVRSVGPAGGPITSLDWRDGNLRVNGTWIVHPPARAALLSLGEEGAADASSPAASNWSGSSGWGYAIFRLPAGKSAVSLQGTTSVEATSSALPRLDIDLPDARFTACLTAQMAHLAMSTVGGETRPGDPMNYPLAWLRDGTYTLTALARSGRLALAEDLARKFAEEDFFGGFGSEGDAPGLALGALEEVASRLDDRTFDAYLWPHFERKAKLILAMMSATAPLRFPYSGPIVPEHRGKKDLDLVADPARDGLINGRMDLHRPLLFVNAVSYRGLLAAAELGDRTRHPEQANLYRAKARELQQAWIRGFGTKERDNERTFVSGIWPTRIAEPVKAEYRAALAARNPLAERPLWTYFTLAEAHQWLLLGEPGRAWETVRWFWDHQSSPGLYTWWEGGREENTFHRWEQVRGWVNPKHVTPHYWTASEMLLLQLDMLAYLDGDTLVIGAGIPPEWKSKKMSVRGLPFGGHKVDWEWDGRKLRVDQHGAAYKIRPAF